MKERFYIIRPSALLLMVFVCLCCTTYGQGTVVFQEDASVRSLFNSYVAKNRAETTIKGWKIQLVSTTDRREMDAIRSQFAVEFPGVPNSWKHISPYYQVRVGAFRSKTELNELLYEVKKSFPAAIAVTDDILKYDLIKY
jgi:hypothetical protein